MNAEATHEDVEETGVHTATFLDTKWMRLIALLVFAGCVALFIVANRDVVDEWMSGTGASEASEYQLCLNDRMAAVDQLAEEAGYTAKQKELAIIRAQEFCRNQTGS